MNMQMLGAGDRRYLILGALVALMGLLSFLDPSGSWGAVVLVGILGGLLAAFVAVQPQVAPTVKLPASKGTVLLVAGAFLLIGGISNLIRARRQLPSGVRAISLLRIHGRAS